MRTPPTAGMAGIRFVGVSPQQAYKKRTSFGGLIPTYFAGTSSVHKGVFVILNEVKDLATLPLRPFAGAQNDRESFVRFVGVSPQQAYKKRISFGGLIPTYKLRMTKSP